VWRGAIARGQLGVQVGDGRGDEVEPARANRYQIRTRWSGAR
jgi:hypothetical protein